MLNMYRKLPDEMREAAESLEKAFDEVANLELFGEGLYDPQVINQIQSQLKLSLYMLVEAVDAELSDLSNYEKSNDGNSDENSDKQTPSELHINLNSALDEFIYLLHQTKLPSHQNDGLDQEGFKSEGRIKAVWGVIAWNCGGINTVDSTLQTLVNRIYAQILFKRHNQFPLSVKIVKAVAHLQYEVICKLSDPREIMIPLTSMLNRSMLYLGHITPPANEPFSTASLISNQYDYDQASHNHNSGSENIEELKNSFSDLSLRLRPLLLSLSTSLVLARELLFQVYSSMFQSGFSEVTPESSELNITLPENDLLGLIFPSRVIPSTNELFVEGLNAQRMMKLCSLAAKSFQPIILRSTSCLAPFLPLIGLVRTGKTLPLSLKADLNLIIPLLGCLTQMSIIITRFSKLLVGAETHSNEIEHASSSLCAVFTLWCVALCEPYSLDLLKDNTSINQVGTFCDPDNLLRISSSSIVRVLCDQLEGSKENANNDLKTPRFLSDLMAELATIYPNSTNMNDWQSFLKKYRLKWIPAIANIRGEITEEVKAVSLELDELAGTKNSDWGAASTGTLGVIEYNDLEEKVSAGKLNSEQVFDEWGSINVLDEDDFCISDQMRCGWAIASIGLELGQLFSKVVDFDKNSVCGFFNLYAGSGLVTLKCGDMAIVQLAVERLHILFQRLFDTPQLLHFACTSDSLPIEEDLHVLFDPMLLSKSCTLEGSNEESAKTSGLIAWRLIQILVSLSSNIPTVFATVIEAVFKSKEHAAVSENLNAGCCHSHTEKTNIDSLLERYIPLCAGPIVRKVMMLSESLLSIYNDSSTITVIETVVRRCPLSSVRCSFIRYVKDKLHAHLRSERGLSEGDHNSRLVKILVDSLSSMVQNPASLFIESWDEQKETELLERISLWGKDYLTLANAFILLASHPDCGGVYLEETNPLNPPKLSIPWKTVKGVVDTGCKLASKLESSKQASKGHFFTIRLLSYALERLDQCLKAE